MSSIIESLNWRYAVKHYDATKKLSDEQVATLLESARLAPSSFGLQPIKIFVVSNPEIRAKLREAGYGQTQITDASHLFVFAVPSKIDDTLVDQFAAHVQEVRNLSSEDVAHMSGMLKGTLTRFPNEDSKITWAAKQAYLAVGVMVAAAALEHIDMSTMEGFDPAAFDEILGLAALGYKSVVIAEAGYRSDTDTTATMPKVRKSKEDFIAEIK